LLICDLTFLNPIKNKVSFLSSDCQKHESTGFNKVIHLAVRHGALDGLIPQAHSSSAPPKSLIKNKKKKVVKKIIQGKIQQGIPRKCVKCSKQFSAKGITKHSKYCRGQGVEIQAKRVRYIL
jgi:predicted nucleic acid binding AN1-type Zn finger protein